MKDSVRTLFFDVFGKKLQDDFLERNLFGIITITLLLFVFISNRYACIKKLRDIDKLQKELYEIRLESLSISNELTENTRRSQVEQMVEKKGLELGIAKEPAYLLHK